MRRLGSCRDGDLSVPDRLPSGGSAGPSTGGKLTGGDLIFFGYKGPKSAISAIYHVDIYLGNGWFIHSTGSSDGVTLVSLDRSTYWKKYFAWGRRLLTRTELTIPKTSSE